MELCNSRVSSIALIGDRATVYFSVAYVHKSKGSPGRDPGSVWAQEAELVVDNAVLSTPLPALPGEIAEGFLEVGGIKHELIPLPFKRKIEAMLCVTFADGSELEVSGCRPMVELLGAPAFVEGPE